MDFKRLGFHLITVLVIFLPFHASCVMHEKEKVAEIFGETIYLIDLDPAENKLERYKRFYPNLSKVDVVNKIRKEKLSSLIWGKVIKQFSENYDVEPTQSEIDDFANSMEKLSPELSPKLAKEEQAILNEAEQKELKKEESKIYRKFVSTYKISKKLYELYGGTVIFQQGNPLEPVGAYRKILETHENNEDFVIYDKEFYTSFWDYYVRKHRRIIPKEKVDYTSPWWKSGLSK
jgi:hypothetical protein